MNTTELSDVKKSITIISRNFGQFLVFVLVILGLYLTSFSSYNLFHSLVEMFSIVIGFSIFILAWNSRQHPDNDYLLFLGIAFLFISGLDMIHTLAYKGMGVFTGYDANLPTQIWIAARYIQSLSLLIAPLFLHRKLNSRLALWGYAVLITVVLAAIFFRVFPDCFVDGSGLTPFKITSEFIIILILLASAAQLLRMRQFFDQTVLKWLIISLFLTIGAEASFTSYISVYGFANLVGHFFKGIAFFYIYKAIVEMGLERPQRLLYRNLQQRELQLRDALKKMEVLATIDDLSGLNNRRHLLELAEQEIDRAHRYQHPVSIIMMDIDFFKQVNDTYGHAAGDQVLSEVAARCRKGLRGIDIMGRWGGDEFAILLPECENDDAVQTAERLRQSIEQEVIETQNMPLAVTISLGVATMGVNCSSLETIFAQADQALYAAKQNGRNIVGNI